MSSPMESVWPPEAAIFVRAEPENEKAATVTAWGRAPAPSTLPGTTIVEPFGATRAMRERLTSAWLRDGRSRRSARSSQRPAFSLRAALWRAPSRATSSSLDLGYARAIRISRASQQGGRLGSIMALLYKRLRRANRSAGCAKNDGLERGSLTQNRG